MKDLRAVFSSAGRGGSVVLLRARPVGRNCSGQHCETPWSIVWDRLGQRVKRCEVTDCALFGLGPPFIIFTSLSSSEANAGKLARGFGGFGGWSVLFSRV